MNNECHYKHFVNRTTAQEDMSDRVDDVKILYKSDIEKLDPTLLQREKES